MTTNEQHGPVYGVPLFLEPMEIGNGMLQAMPTAKELEEARVRHERLVAAYEVLTHKYREAMLLAGLMVKP